MEIWFHCDFEETLKETAWMNEWRHLVLLVGEISLNTLLSALHCIWAVCRNLKNGRKASLLSTLIFSPCNQLSQKLRDNCALHMAQIWDFSQQSVLLAMNCLSEASWCSLWTAAGLQPGTELQPAGSSAGTNSTLAHVRAPACGVIFKKQKKKKSRPWSEPIINLKEKFEMFKEDSKSLHWMCLSWACSDTSHGLSLIPAPSPFCAPHRDKIIVICWCNGKPLRDDQKWRQCFLGGRAELLLPPVKPAAT